jgi:hypothetical protein
VQSKIGGSSFITSKRFNLVTITRLPIIELSLGNWRKRFQTLAGTPMIHIKNRHRLLESAIDISQTNQLKIGIIN